MEVEMAKRTHKHAGLKGQNVPKQRRNYLDYDYVGKLSETEKDFLAKFSDEYYGADLDINPTYIVENGDYVQISGNSDPSKNRDLRKYRGVEKFYRNERGNFCKSPEHKYSKKNLHNTAELRQTCNQNANSNARDIMSVGQSSNVAKDEFQYFLENLQEGISPEEEMLLREILEERLKLEEK